MGRPEAEENDRLGVGVGARDDGFAASGLPTADRGRRLDEQLARNSPRPIRGDIPIVVGGSGERRTLRLVAQHADGCNVFGDPARVPHLMNVLEGHCEAVGRDSAEITTTRLGTIAIGRTWGEAVEKLDELRRRRRMSEDRLRLVTAVGDRARSQNRRGLCWTRGSTG